MSTSVPDSPLTCSSADCISQHSQASISSPNSDRILNVWNVGRQSSKFARRSGMVGLGAAGTPDQDTISARGKASMLFPPNSTCLHLYPISSARHSSFRSFGRPNEMPKPVQPESWKLIPSCPLTPAALSRESRKRYKHQHRSFAMPMSEHQPVTCRTTSCLTMAQPKPRPTVCLLSPQRCSDWPALRGPSAHRSVLHAPS